MDGTGSKRTKREFLVVLSWWNCGDSTYIFSNDVYDTVRASVSR